MNKMRVVFFALLIASLLSWMSVIVEAVVSDNSIETEAQISNEPEWVDMTATAYCLKGKMANGKQTRTGVCAASREHFGQTACVYLLNSDGSRGEFIGYYECNDVCPKNGVLDIWMPTYNECIQFGRKKVTVVFVNAKG